MPVDAVRIAYRDGRNGSTLWGDVSETSVSDGAVARFQMLDLQNFTFKRCDWRQLLARDCAYAVDSDAEPYHIVLILCESLDPGGIEDVQHRPVAYFADNPFCIGLEHPDLSESEIVRIRVLRRSQV